MSNKTWNALLDRNTGKELKRTLRDERKQRARLLQAKQRINESEWQAELRRLGFNS